MPTSASGFLPALLAVAFPVMLTGCGSDGVGPSYRVETVADQLAVAGNDKSVRLYAASLLSDATLTLDRARASNDPDLRRHLAYMAQRKVDIARSTSGLMVARESMARLPERPAQNASPSHTAREIKTQASARHAHASAGSSVAALDPAYGARAAHEHRPNDEDAHRPVTVIEFSEFAADAAEWEKSLAIESKLQPILRYLRENPHARILIEGFVQAFGSKDYALTRSLALAESIKQYMMRNGISDERVLTLGNTATPDKFDRVAGAGQAAVDRNRVEISLFAR